MTRRAAAAIGWSATVLAVPLVGGAMVLEVMQGRPVGILWISVVTCVAYAATGTLIVTRFPRHLVGWLLVWFGFGLAWGVFVETYAVVEPAPPGQVWVAWLGSFQWVTGPFPLVILLPLLFPDGRPLSPRWHWAGWLALGGMAAVMVSFMLAPGPMDYAPGMENPMGVEGWRSALDVLFLLGIGAAAVSLVAAVASVVMRFRRSSGLQRQQLKWFGVGASITVAGALVLAVLFATDRLELGQGVFVLGALGLPISIGIAILRYRLYDIDLVINRTLVYASLTGFLGLVYVAGVVGLPRLLPFQGDNDLFVAGSTLAVAALFSPARRGIQAFVDRRFYRSRYDAARTVEAFSTRLRDEVDLETLTRDLQRVVRATLQPAHVSVWLRPPPGTGR